MPPTAAAQYLRMSTEHQRYSLENQATAIAAYADEHGLQVVRSYADAGKSGVTIKGRNGLKTLLADVLAGTNAFSQILILDVSRWGRYQDPDQAAHYEFLCREAGYPVRYCAEPFENDGTAMASLMKNMKRVMAAEFSRELSDKARAAQIRAAGRGFKMGGSCPYGLRREVTDEHGKPVAELGPGERKAIASHHVRYALGPSNEQRTIRQLFRWYVVEGLPLTQIVARLNATPETRPCGAEWTVRRLQGALRCELYAGIYVFNRTRQRFRVPVHAGWLFADQ